MQIKFKNSPEINTSNKYTWPEAKFLSYMPDFVLMEKFAQKYSGVKNIIVIGHGGSITSFLGIYYALKNYSTKQVEFLSTVDPAKILQLKDLYKPKDTLVIAISKSGETVTQIEAVLQFLDYQLLFITGAVGPLSSIAEKLSADMVIHPNIGGRFTGLTEVGLLPAAICGFQVKDIHTGAQMMYQSYQQNNVALEAAGVLFSLEQQGYVDVFLPIYSSRLYYFQNLIVQLCHESFAKNSLGQTYYAHEAPESQHHTNQRLFDGRKNTALFCISYEVFKKDLVTKVPINLQNIALKNTNLETLDKTSLLTAIHFERDGVLETAGVQDIPNIDLRLNSINESAIGQFIAFWQLFAIYSAVLRSVDPFNQPGVEASKNLSFTKRLSAAGK